MVIQYANPVMGSLITSFVSSFNTYLDSWSTFFKIEFGVFMGILAFIFIFIWVPYLKTLSKKIWRTKGMLNMIPMDLMTKNENLKVAFVSPDLQKAVR